MSTMIEILNIEIIGSLRLIHTLLLLVAGAIFIDIISEEEE